MAEPKGGVGMWLNRLACRVHQGSRVMQLINGIERTLMQKACYTPSLQFFSLFHQVAASDVSLSLLEFASSVIHQRRCLQTSEVSSAAEGK